MVFLRSLTRSRRQKIVNSTLQRDQGRHHIARPVLDITSIMKYTISLWNVRLAEDFRNVGSALGDVLAEVTADKLVLVADAAVDELLGRPS
jgi:hypothetical protein